MNVGMDKEMDKEFRLIQHELFTIIAKWRTFTELFGIESNVKLLNEAMPLFFWFVQDIFLDLRAPFPNLSQHRLDISSANRLSRCNDRPGTSGQAEGLRPSRHLDRRCTSGRRFPSRGPSTRHTSPDWLHRERAYINEPLSTRTAPYPARVHPRASGCRRYSRI